MPRSTLALLPFLAACGELVIDGGLGVSPGGSQDVGFARDRIAAGQIPDQEHFTAEGLFSEHTLPLTGAPCEALLCPRTAATVHRPYEGDEALLVQLGFGTDVTPETFERPPLELVFLIDVSCSMTGSPLEHAKEALLAAADHLGPADHAALVEYGSQPVVRARSMPMDDAGREHLRDAVHALAVGGSTDMEAGMRTAYELLDASRGGQQRLMIFADAQPNSGVTEQSAFVQLVRDHAADGVGLTFVGVGPALGTELADAIGKVRGGNSVYVGSGGVEAAFGDDFDYLVTPVAYDLEVALTPRDDHPVGQVYGAPVDGGEVRLGAATLFLSSQDGGMAVTLQGVPDGPAALGTMAVSYQPVGSDERVEDEVAVRWEGGDYHGDADDLGVAKVDVLVHEYDAMVAAADACDGRRSFEDAAAQVDAAREVLASLAVDLSLPDLEVEVELMAKLAQNLREPAPQCLDADTWLY